MGEVEKLASLLGFLAPVDSRDEEAEKTAGVQAWPLPALFFSFLSTADFGSWLGKSIFFLLEERDLIEVSPSSVWRSVVGWGRIWRQEKIRSHLPQL